MVLWDVHFRFVLQGCRPKLGGENWRLEIVGNWDILGVYKVGSSRVADHPRAGVHKIIESESWKSLRNHRGLNQLTLSGLWFSCRG